MKRCGYSIRRCILAVLLVCAGVAAEGQRFEWAKGFGTRLNDSNGEGCYIKGTVTDSAGNLYFLGKIGTDSDWEESDLCPVLDYYRRTVKGVIVAKISPAGEMVWKKVVIAKQDNTIPYDIKPLGDTGFAVMFYAVNVKPDPESIWVDFLYWLDTLYTDYYPLNPYQYPDLRLGDAGFTAYLAFDFDGNVTEQYLLQFSGVDTLGNDIVYYPYLQPDSLPWLKMSSVLIPSFDVDSAGNIYICRLAADQFGWDYSSCEGTVSALKVWVNHCMVGEFPIEKRDAGTLHLLKFSPHFDTILAYRYLIQKSDTTNFNHDFYHLKVDGKELFLSSALAFEIPDANLLVFDSTNNVSVSISEKTMYKGIVTIHDLELETQRCLNLKDSIINSSRYFSASIMSDIAFEKDSGLVFINGNVRRNPNLFNEETNSLFLYGNRVLPLNSHAFVLSLNRDDYTFHSISLFPSESGTIKFVIHGNLAVQNNRIFLQGSYCGEFVLFEDTFYARDPSLWGLGLAIFDYQGHLIGGADYNSFSIAHHHPGPIALRDSNLYLINHLTADADFGEHHVYAAGYDPYVSVALYVDTSFMTPYVYRAPGGGAGIAAAAESRCTVYPNPTLSELTVETDEAVERVAAVSVYGIREPLTRRGKTVDVSRLRPGLYLLEVVTPTHNYYHKFIKR